MTSVDRRAAISQVAVCYHVPRLMRHFPTSRAPVDRPVTVPCLVCSNSPTVVQMLFLRVVAQGGVPKVSIRPRS
jgi:hypothetical protein